MGFESKVGQVLGLISEERKLFLSITCSKINLACILVSEIHPFLNFLGKRELF